MTVPERYARNIPGLSEADCARLAHARVGIFGCGGVGSWVAETLARMGVGYLRLIDFDINEESNLNRQLFATESTLDMPKVQAGAERLRAVNSSTEIDFHCMRYTADMADELLEGLDLVVNEIDVICDRISLIQEAHKRGLPVVHAAVNTWRVSACSFLPQDTLPHDLSTFFTTCPEDGIDIDGTIVPTGLPFNCLTAAGICTSEATRILLGLEPASRGRRMILDLAGRDLFVQNSGAAGKLLESIGPLEHRQARHPRTANRCACARHKEQR